jgi:hypothetical protein
MSDAQFILPISTFPKELGFTHRGVEKRSGQQQQHHERSAHGPFRNIKARTLGPGRRHNRSRRLRSRR